MGRVDDLQTQAEQAAGRVTEQLVRTPVFGDVLARSAQTGFALARAGADVADAWIASLRLAGRRDVARLAEQLGRTEDKLERVLAEVERLQAQAGPEKPRERARSSNGSSSSRRRKPAAKKSS